MTILEITLTILRSLILIAAAAYNLVAVYQHANKTRRELAFSQYTALFLVLLAIALK